MSKVKRAKPAALQKLEMRKQEKAKVAKAATSTIEELVEKEKDMICTRAFKMAVVLPTVVIMDSFGKLMPKKDRVKTFIKLVTEQWFCVAQGQVTLDELAEQIEKETEGDYNLEFVMSDLEKELERRGL